MSIVFMGTPDFAVPALEQLVLNGYEVVVYTQPDRAAGRGKRRSTVLGIATSGLFRGLRALWGRG